MTLELYQIQEQECREAQQNQQAEDWGFAALELAELVKRWGKVAIATELATYPDPIVSANCSNCIHWRLEKELLLADGSTFTTRPYCSLRAASDLLQLPQTYADRCQFYDPNTPF